MATATTATTTVKQRVLFCGLGGGLDIINASLLYFAAVEAGVEAYLGSTRPISQADMENIRPFSSAGAFITGETKITRRGRYIEPIVAKLLGTEVLMFSRLREEKGESATAELSEAFLQARSLLGLTSLVFVDGILLPLPLVLLINPYCLLGGGDSLILKQGDGCSTSETTNPFEGGDAETLAALLAVPDSYLGVVAMGLDVSRDAFLQNVDLLKQRKKKEEREGEREEGEGGYKGRVNIYSRQMEEYSLDHILPFGLLIGEKAEGEGTLLDKAMQKYNQLAESVLVLEHAHIVEYNQVLQNINKRKKTNPTTTSNKETKQEQEVEEDPAPKRMPSHTATITYHAVNGHWGWQRTFVPWEPKARDESGQVRKGVLVGEEFAWLYFFAAPAVEALKLELNAK
ncbi:hypothetical protein QOT17_007444 [Balamuthia mandrillaris]